MTSLSASPFKCGGDCLRAQRNARPGRASANRCVYVRANLKDSKFGLSKAGTSLLAIALWTGFNLAAPNAQHLAAFADDNNTSAYNRRLADTQKRRELLTQARQNALAKGEQSKALASGEAEDPEVVAANREVEEKNAKRAEESERSLEALRQKAADAYSRQASKGGPGLRGVSYSLSETPSAPAFNFSDPPEALSVPEDPTPSLPVDPGSVMNSSSASPMPSALAPLPTKQQEGAASEQEMANPFEGIFDTPKSESGPSNTSLEAPSQSFQEDRPRATEPPAKVAKALVQEPAKEVSKSSNKRQGPLPLFLGQFLVLAAYGGLGFLAFKKDEETRKAIAILLGIVQKGYSKVQQLLPSGSKS